MVDYWANMGLFNSITTERFEIGIACQHPSGVLDVVVEPMI